MRTDDVIRPGLHGQRRLQIARSDARAERPSRANGHAVWKAMRELGRGEIAAVVVANRTDPETKALRLALNRIPTDAAWDNDRLRAELEQLVSLSFDLELKGFDAVEIDHLLEVDVPKLNVTEDGEPIPPPQSPAITDVGDIWTCGRHHIGCGDARDQAFIDKIMGGLRASMCFVDPPYNVPILSQEKVASSSGSLSKVSVS